MVVCRFSMEDNEPLLTHTTTDNEVKDVPQIVLEIAVNPFINYLGLVSFLRSFLLSIVLFILLLILLWENGWEEGSVF